MRLVNSSNTPVYDVMVIVVPANDSELKDGRNISARENRVLFSMLPPGGYWHTAFFRSVREGSAAGIELAFVDGSGRNWVRQCDGHLKLLKCKTVRQYYSWNDAIGYSKFDVR